LNNQGPHQRAFLFWRIKMRKILCWLGIHTWQITYWKIQCVKCQLLTCKHCGELDCIDDEREWV